MIRSIDTLSRNFDILQKKQENISANVANINTAGYKSQELIQSTLASKPMVNHLGGPLLNQQNDIGSFTFGNQIDEVYTNFEQGGLKGTASITDIALQSDGFFTIAGDDGQTYYTRNGNFTANADGELVTQEGHHVMGIDAGGQPTFIPAGGMDFSVDSTGNINGTGLRLLVTEFNDPSTLTSVGDTLYTGQGGTAMNGGVTIYQSMVETSNVKTADEITNLMMVSREFGANQKMLNAADETLKKSVNEIGRV
ncbi:flagellar hook-basal body protein [Carnobacterium antarcticum]|uniref:Flagellar hook-basal body protein n=1 Tax=Carnobacterium antarcticum TaxID=2126436 RepID=A0ABW4NM61_9LACT|nr:flagellar hook-basal body complex protein [Carnobacterium sp. CP1]ALV22025.1 Flagellar basal-body rod protein FlgF [Carnobacterium sp. CP1]